MNSFLVFIFVFISIYIEFHPVKSLKYKSATFSELSLINEVGKQFWESLSDKANVPHYGSCWKNAISELRLGCNYLTEHVQSDLALRFTDCFLQMSGYEPMSCTSSNHFCLKQLSDRAFNAYTEFYTHTQSICYFLQSQVWHEEAQKTIDKLSETSVLVTAQLQAAGEVQRKILSEQKESLLFQHHLLDVGKLIASTLESSESKISKIMSDFQESAGEQKQVLFELFDKVSMIRSWVVDEMTWINSIAFYMAFMIIGYLFTSISSTRQARIYIFLTLTVNYFIERFIYSHLARQLNNHYSDEYLNSMIWLLRRVSVIVSMIILIYSALVYCDYNIANHKLLLEIKRLNVKLLNSFESNNSKINERMPTGKIKSKLSAPQGHVQNEVITSLPCFTGEMVHKGAVFSPLFNDKNRTYCSPRYQRKILPEKVDIDDTDSKSELTVILEKRSDMSDAPITPYNLRSLKLKKVQSTGKV